MAFSRVLIPLVRGRVYHGYSRTPILCAAGARAVMGPSLLRARRSLFLALFLSACLCLALSRACACACSTSLLGAAMAA
eukprot:3999613-Pleurochrysis_carterae.AAC.1